MIKLLETSITILILSALAACSAQNVQHEKKPTPQSQATLKPAPEAAKQMSSYQFTDTTRYDFGELTAGGKISHKFTVQNTGEYPMRIHQVKPAGGGLNAWHSKEEIPLGEFGVVKLFYDTKGKSGKIVRSATVVFEDALPKYAVLQVYATIIESEPVK